MYAGMKSLTAYFGEDWDAGDPSRVLRVVRDFVNLFDKAHREIEVLPLSCSTSSPTQPCGSQSLVQPTPACFSSQLISS